MLYTIHFVNCRPSTGRASNHKTVSTNETRQSQWRKYFNFCSRVNIQAFPMNCESICLFLVHVALSRLSFSTINNQVSALVILGKLHGQSLDIHSDFDMHTMVLTLKASRPILGDYNPKRCSFSLVDLLSMSRYVNSGDFLQISTWIGMVFLYRIMLRKCHIFADKFNDHLFIRSDIDFTVRVSSSIQRTVIVITSMPGRW